jgi:hypothetical protein
MATGRLPFDGPTAAVLFDAILNREPVPPSQLESGAASGDGADHRQALEKDRDVRYQSARDMLADLKRLKRDSVSGRFSLGFGTGDGHRLRRRAREPDPPGAVDHGSGVLAVVSGALCSWRWWAAPPPRPRITGTTQITNDRLIKARPVTDGPRLYFSARRSLSDSPEEGFLPSVRAPEARRSRWPRASRGFSTSPPTGTELLLSTFKGTEMKPTCGRAGPGRNPRRLGDLRIGNLGFGGAWSPDGATIV